MARKAVVAYSAILFCLGALASCGRREAATVERGPTNGEGSEAVVVLGPAPALTCKAKPQYRWRDALGHPYSASFRQNFSYEKAKVELRYERRAPVFRGRLVARGLKPNFAYQIKLVGMPRSLWGEDAEPESNRRIGEVGRWWIPGNDARNAYFVEDLDRNQMEGYLVFDYFVTDAGGNAEKTFEVRNSLHVLWRTDQWPPGEPDTEPTRHKIVATADNPAYDQTFPEGVLEIYAEAESGRPPLGKALLPPGDYRCFFLLTEESFHDYFNEDGGDWAAALTARVEFTITPARQP